MMFVAVVGYVRGGVGEDGVGDVVEFVGLVDGWLEFGGHDAVLAVLAEAEHMADAAQNTGLFGARLVLAVVQGALEGAVAVTEATFVVRHIFEQPGLAGL